jgi:hypothetical protein
MGEATTPVTTPITKESCSKSLKNVLKDLIRSDQRTKTNKLQYENYQPYFDCVSTVKSVSISFPEPAILGKEREALG